MSTPHDKLSAGFLKLSQAGTSAAELGQTLITFHGALEDHFDAWLAVHADLSPQERIELGRQGWNTRLEQLGRSGILHRGDVGIIRRYNTIRNKVAHGDDFHLSYPQVAEYASFVGDLIGSCPIEPPQTLSVSHAPVEPPLVGEEAASDDQPLPELSEPLPSTRRTLGSILLGAISLPFVAIFYLLQLSWRLVVLLCTKPAGWLALALLFLYFTCVAPIGAMLGGVWSDAAARAPSATRASSTSARATPSPSQEVRTPDAASPTVPSTRAAQIVGSGGNMVNMRDAPGLHSVVIAKLEPGAPIIVLDEQSEADGKVWQRVQHGGREGWVSAEFVGDSEG
jgi:hypothetical protein